MTARWIVGGVDPGLDGGVVFLEPRLDKTRPSAVFPASRIVVTELLPYVMPKTGGKKFNVQAFVWDMSALTHEIVRCDFLVRMILFEKTTAHRISRRDETGKWQRMAPEGGHSFGMTAGAQLAGAHMIPNNAVVEVATDKWRSAVGLSKLPSETWKDAESKVALQLWPETPEIAAHEGLAAAALIALSGLQGWGK